MGEVNKIGLKGIRDVLEYLTENNELLNEKLKRMFNTQFLSGNTKRKRRRLEDALATAPTERRKGSSIEVLQPVTQK